jgi:hypothetical protein
MISQHTSSRALRLSLRFHFPEHRLLLVEILAMVSFTIAFIITVHPQTLAGSEVESCFARMISAAIRKQSTRLSLAHFQSIVWRAAC